MKRVLSTLPLVGLLAASGCQEDPSFFLSWKLAGLEDPRDPDDLPDLKSALQCSEHGLGQLQLSTFVPETGLLVDQRTYPCYPQGFPDELADGPELEPGTYAVRLEGLRDTGEVWERKFCSEKDIPAEWDPTPTCGSYMDDAHQPENSLGDGPLDCVCEIGGPECVPPGESCDPGEAFCPCRSAEEQDEDAADKCDGDLTCKLPPYNEDFEDEPPPEDGTCVPEQSESSDIVWRCQFARDETTVTIVEDATTKPTLSDYVLVHPPECDDGVDNDADGLTDLNDQACLLSPLFGKEEDEKDLTLINIDVTYFDDNPNINCPGLGIGRLSLRIDRGDGFEEIAEASCNTPVTAFEPITLALDAGEYPVEVVGIRAATEDEPATVAKIPLDEEGQPTGVVVKEGQGAFLKSTIDIGPDDLLAPINGEIRMKFSFQQADGLVWAACQDPPGGGLLDGTGQDDGLTRIALTVYEETGFGDERSWTALDPNTIFDVPSLQDAVVNGDALELPCALAGNKELRSLDVDWKRYAVRATASESGGEACFDAMLDMDTDPFRLAPGSDANLVILPRVLEDGAAVGACIDCNETTDCDDSHVCVDNVCEAP